MSSEIQIKYLKLALEEAQKCTPSPTAFCVGAVITVTYPPEANPIVLATGYSRAGVVINFVTATGGDVEMLRSIECFYKCVLVPIANVLN